MNAIYADLMEKIRSENMKFDFGYESIVIDDEKRNTGVYMRYEALHKGDFLEYVNNAVFSYVSLPFDQQEFITQYMEFMECYTSRIRNTRYAVSVIIAYPLTMKDKNIRKKFIKRLVQDICGIDVNVPYFVENFAQGCCEYARITMIERIYLGRERWKIHKKDIYIDSRTGKFASSSCPKEFKIKKCSAGSPVLDKNGEKVPGTVVFSNSLRIFSFAKDPVSKRNKWEEFIFKLKQIYINTVLVICEKVQAVKHGKRLHKTTNKPTYHRYVKRRIAAINYAKQCVEYMINYLLQNECEKDVIYHPYNPVKDDIVKHSERYTKIVSIFHKYKERFKKKSFHDEDGNEYELDYYNQRVDILDKNIEKLLDNFFKDISGIMVM